CSARVGCGVFGCCESADLNGDRVTHRKEALVVRDFAIVMSPDFRVMTETVDGIEIRYYYIIDPTPELSLKIAVDSVRTFNEHIGMFPYPTLAVVETHFLHGGMEYPRLVMISNELSGDLYREVIVHEVAHQWWYAVVGNNPVLHAWMDEGLTEYTTTLFYVWNPQYGITYQERMADKLTGLLLYLELYGRQRPDTSMNRPLNEFRNSYDYMYMVYVKGGLMFSSLRRMIGNDNFFAALKLYYEQNFFQMARPENLIAAFEQASGKPLEAYFDSWLSGRVQMFAE
ncbi:MAG: M1 family peptidase, partial [Firmicutes bacterium]|nr:M1 family peptidase [Bacillota bacterium]